MILFSFTALDLRVLRKEFDSELNSIVSEELASSFGISSSQLPSVSAKLRSTMQHTLDKTTTMDAADQMHAVVGSVVVHLVEFGVNTSAIPTFRSKVASRAADALHQLRSQYLSGKRGRTPAASYLGKTRGLYEFIRVTLGIKMHGMENFSGFANGLGKDDVTVGQNVTYIYEVCSFALRVFSL